MDVGEFIVPIPYVKQVKVSVSFWNLNFKLGFIQLTAKSSLARKLTLFLYWFKSYQMLVGGL